MTNQSKYWMAKIIPFKPRASKPLSDEELAQQLLSPEEAVNAIVSGMVCYVVPIWVEHQWPFHLLEIMADELRSAMSQNAPKAVRRFQVEAIIEELKPVWKEIAEHANLIF